MSQSEGRRRRKLPARYASIMMPLLLSIKMTFVVSLIATAKSIGFHTPHLITNWMSAWALSWAVSFPVLLAVQPMVRKMVAFICHPH